MRNLIFILALFTSVCTATPFPDLIKKEYIFNFQKNPESDDRKKTYLSYNKKFYHEINTALNELDISHPLHIGSEHEVSNDILLGILDLSGKGDTYYVVLGWGPSYDINYSFYREEKLKSYKSIDGEYIRSDFEVYAPSLVVPGNGNVYSYGYNNNIASIKRKYVYNNGKLEEIPQEFYYIGEKTLSLKDQILYSSADITKEIFRISKGTPVTIVGIQVASLDPYTELFVVASEFGLIGYTKADSSGENQFKGFYFNGD